MLLAQPPAADIIFQIIIQNYYTRERVSERERERDDKHTYKRETNTQTKDCKHIIKRERGVYIWQCTQQQTSNLLNCTNYVVCTGICSIIKSVY